METIKKIIKWSVGYRRFKCSLHSGKGFIEGNGTDISCEKVSIFGIEFISSICFDTESEWFTKLKSKLECKK